MAEGENIHGVILYELAVEIIGQGTVVQPCSQSFHRFIVQADVENGFHVATGLAIHAGAHGQQQGLGFASKLFHGGGKVCGGEARRVWDDEALRNGEA